MHMRLHAHCLAKPSLVKSSAYLACCLIMPQANLRRHCVGASTACDGPGMGMLFHKKMPT